MHEYIKHDTTPQTVNGLMGHSKIRGVQTDETIVEAVNKQLNSNTRQVRTRARARHNTWGRVVFVLLPGRGWCGERWGLSRGACCVVIGM